MEIDVNFVRAWNSSDTIMEVCDKLGISLSNPGNLTRVREKAQRYGLDHIKTGNNYSLGALLTKEERQAVVEYYEGICQGCKSPDYADIVQVDHIDGNRRNNDPSNLTLLCPNCHSQTDTFCKIKGSESTVCVRCEESKQFYRRYCFRCALGRYLDPYEIEHLEHLDELVRRRDICLWILWRVSTEGCNFCHITEWQGRSLVFQLDHIDGDNRNNAVSNLRQLCPNCHAKTDTYTFKKGVLPYSTGKAFKRRLDAKELKGEDNKCPYCKQPIAKSSTTCGRCVFIEENGLEWMQSLYKDLKSSTKGKNMDKIQKKYGQRHTQVWRKMATRMDSHNSMMRSLGEEPLFKTNLDALFG